MATKKSGKSKLSKELCQIITPEFRVSYPHVFKAQAPKPTDKAKFSITMLFPKKIRDEEGELVDNPLMGSSRAGKPRSLKEVIRNAKVSEFGADKSEWPEELQSPVVDGDSPKFADKQGYKGHWVIKAVSNENQRPVVVDHEMTVITNPNDLYPGCYARSYIFSYVWEYMGKQGVGFILEHVQKLRDGKSFGGKMPVEQVFQPVALSDDDESDEEDDSGFL